MIGTAYDLTCVLVRVVARFGKWLLLPTREECASAAEVEESAGRAVRAVRAKGRAVAKELTAAGIPVASVVEQLDPAPKGVDASAESTRRSVLDDRSGNAGEYGPRARIVTREGPGYRVHFYFRLGDSAVRRVVMFDFMVLRERFGVVHAAAMHARLGYRSRQRASRVREPESKWGRLVLPDAQVNWASPYDLAALSMIDDTLTEVERFVDSGRLPALRAVEPEPVKPAPKSRTAKSSGRIDPPATSDRIRDEEAGPAARAGKAGRSLKSAGASRTARATLPAPSVDERPDRGRPSDTRVPNGIGGTSAPVPHPGTRIDDDQQPQKHAIEGSPAGNSASVGADSPARIVMFPPEPDPAPVPKPGYGVQTFVGTFLESGLAERTAIESGRRFTCFYADVETDGVVVRHTGSDLERALKLAGIGRGDRIELTYHGSVPLSAGKMRKKLWKAFVIQKATEAGSA